MTRLLVSVRSATEARDAVAGGADIIDVKEPQHGSLGRSDVQVWRDVVAAVGNHAPVSVALGEIQDLGSGIGDWDLGGVAYAKIGLAGCQNDLAWRERLRQLWQSLPPSIQPVAVIYADWRQAEAPSPESVLELAAECRVRHILVDTFVKSAGRLLDHWPLAELGRFAAQIQQQDQKLVLAGSLDAATIRQVLPLHPWAVAVRGAVCQGTREGDVAVELVRALGQFVAIAPNYASRHALPPVGGASL